MPFRLTPIRRFFRPRTGAEAALPTPPNSPSARPRPAGFHHVPNTLRRLLPGLLTLLALLGGLDPGPFSVGAPVDPDPALLPSPHPRADLWEADGPVHALLATNGWVYVAGEFTWIAPRAPRVTAIDASTADLLPGFPTVSGGPVHALLPDDRGGWFIAGAFTRVGPVARRHLARLNPDFSLDPAFRPEVDGPVRALALQGATLYLAGGFSEVNDQARSRLAALQADTGGLLPWNPGANDTVHALLATPTSVIVGGEFTTVAGQARTGLAAFDPLDGALLNWAPPVNGPVLALAADDDTILAGGAFTIADQAPRAGLAQFVGPAPTGTPPSTAPWVTPWNPDPRETGGGPATVLALRIACGTVFVGGTFDTIGIATRARVAAVSLATGIALGWNARLGSTRAGGTRSAVHALEVSGDTLIVGGAFATVNSEAHADLALLELSSGRRLPGSPALDGRVTALAANGRRLLAATQFGPGGRERRFIAALDERTGEPADWNPILDGPVQALAFQDQRLFLGGSFTTVNGQGRQNLAAIDARTGGLFTDWATPVNGPVQALLLADSGTRLVVAGPFTTVNGISRAGLAALDPPSGLVLGGWSPRVDGGSVRALLEQNGVVYLGGDFSQVALQPRARLAAIHSTSGAVLAWNPAASGPVLALAAAPASPVDPNPLLRVGGAFTQLAGQPAAGLAALHPLTGQLVPWPNIAPLAAPPANAPDVRALAVAGPWVFAGGGAFEVASQARHTLVAIATNGVVAPWFPTFPAPAAAQSIHTLWVDHGTLFSAGSAESDRPGLPPLAGLTEWPAPGAPTAPPDALVASPAEPVVRSSVQLTLNFTPPPATTVQWQFNGLDLAGETNTTLIRTNLQIADSGRYRVLLFNASGATSLSLPLTVLEPPLILVPPAPVTTAPGTNVTLSVVATGHPAPVYQWRLNGIAIPGATGPTLLLPTVTPRSAGGYSVGVANRAGALLSAPAAVTVVTPNSPFANPFASRGTLTGSSGAVRGSSTGATREATAGEPLHAGKLGGASVWARWVAPVSGLTAFTTRGSSFDTLLAIYTNSTLSQLRAVDSDEDRGGFLTSRVVFNAVAGTEYQIAVDGLAGATGNYTVSWETEANAPPLPVIASPPLPRTVAPGNTATFSVTTLNVPASPAPTYQWFFGCTPIRHATNATLLLLNVQPRQAGNYHVEITAANGRTLESLPVALEVGTLADVRSFPKLEDLRAADGAPAPAAAPGAADDGFVLAGGLGTPLFQLSLGLPISHTFSTSTNSPGLLTPDCDVLTGAATFVGFRPSASGVVRIDTTGSLFDTVLSVYRYVDPLQLAANELACDNDGAPDQVRSRVTLPAEAGQSYLIRVSGVGGARGQARVTWQLGVAPLILQANEAVVAMAGSPFTLDSGLSVPEGLGTTYQWFRNGIPIANATNATLLLAALGPDDGGAYSVAAANFAGSTTSLRASVSVRLPLHLSAARWSSSTRFTFLVGGQPGDPFVVEFTTTLAPDTTWTTLATGVLPANGSPVEVHDDNARPGPTLPRFYRVRPPTP